MLVDPQVLATLTKIASNFNSYCNGCLATVSATEQKVEISATNEDYPNGKIYGFYQIREEEATGYASFLPEAPDDVEDDLALAAFGPMRKMAKEYVEL